MTTKLEDQLAEALQDAMEWNWADEEALPASLVRFCGGALAAYDAAKAKPAPLVREVTHEDEYAAAVAYTNGALLGVGIRSSLNSFRDRLNGEA